MNKGKVAGLKPSVSELAAGAYYWCSCGESQKQPFCDGSHKGTEFVPMQFLLEIPTRVALCNCKQTATAPYCDGAHCGI